MKTQRLNNLLKGIDMRKEDVNSGSLIPEAAEEAKFIV